MYKLVDVSYLKGVLLSELKEQGWSTKSGHVFMMSKMNG